MMYVSQITMLYTLNFYSVVFQFISKLGGKVKIKKTGEILWDLGQRDLTYMIHKRILVNWTSSRLESFHFVKISVKGTKRQAPD